MLLPNSVKAPAFDKVKLSAGVVVEVATLDVRSGDRLPALKLVTVPPVAGVCHVAAVPLVAVGTCPEVGVPVTVTPSIAVAPIIPVPDTVRLPPLPITRGFGFVPAVMALKGGVPPLPPPQARPASVITFGETNFTQSLATTVPCTVTLPPPTWPPPPPPLVCPYMDEQEARTRIKNPMTLFIVTPA